MVASSFRQRWSPTRFWQRIRYLIRSPGDILLLAQVGYFIWHTPRRLERMPLPELLADLRAAKRRASSRPPRPDPAPSVARINRLSGPWFRLTPLRSYNTCYLRALMYYRFLDAERHDLKIHFVVEPPRAHEQRLRGHAWVTVGDTAIEPPLPEVMARTRSIYTFPGTEV